MKKRKTSKKNEPVKADKFPQAVVYVSLKKGVLDPPGLTIKRALDDLGYEGIREVRSGKFYQITLDQIPRQKVKKLVAEISDKLLANPVIERFEVKIGK